MTRWLVRAATATAGLLALFLCGCSGGGGGKSTTAENGGQVTVLAYNDLGMHCMNQDFSQYLILPPYNNLHAQVIDRTGEDPRIITSGVTIRYSIPGNTHSSDKTNFWQYANALFNVQLAPDTGLAGNTLAGTMVPTALGDWWAQGIPLTPVMDDGTVNSYQLATVSVEQGGTTVATTQAVTPVSWEMHCDYCHGTGTTPGVLEAHDALHATNLQAQKPVLCGSCHQQPELGTLAPGQQGLPTLSGAMHTAHAPRMAPVLPETNNNPCYACHPGTVTKCLRGVHAANGLTCTSCHTSMEAVGSPTRRPWVDEPRCSSCHTRAGFEFEQPDTLYRNSRGHHGVTCEACHGSPHAIAPSTEAADNAQAIALQGHAGTIDTCTVCHRQQPDDAFTHRLAGGD